MIYKSMDFRKFLYNTMACLKIKIQGCILHTAPYKMFSTKLTILLLALSTLEINCNSRTKHSSGADYHSNNQRVFKSETCILVLVVR